MVKQSSLLKFVTKRCCKEQEEENSAHKIVTTRAWLLIQPFPRQQQHVTESLGYNEIISVFNTKSRCLLL